MVKSHQILNNPFAQNQRLSAHQSESIEEYLKPNNSTSEGSDDLSIIHRPDIIRYPILRCAMSVTIALVTILISPCAADILPTALIPVSVKTTSNDPTYIFAPVDEGLDYYEFSPTNQLFAAVVKDGYDNIPCAFLYTKTGARYASIPSEPTGGGFFQNTHSVVLKDPLKLVMTEIDRNNWAMVKIQDNGGTGTMSWDGYGTSHIIGDVGLSRSQISTVYIFMVSDSRQRIGKYDFVTRSGSSRPNSEAKNPAFLVLSESLAVGVYAMTDGDKFAFFSLADLNSIVDRTIGGSLRPALMINDNLNDTMMFGLTKSSSGSCFLNWYNFTSTGTVAGLLFSTPYACSKYNLLNFGPYQYLGFICNARLYVFSKQTLTLIIKADFPAATTSVIETRGAVGSFGHDTLDRGYFGLYEASNKNFQSYYVKFGLCANRPTATLVCQICEIGAYRNDSSSVWNYCTLKADFPNSYGANETTNTFLPCSTTNCANCTDNYAVCIRCNTTNGYFMNNATGTCVHTSNITAGFGGNTTDGSIWPCIKSNCIDCKANSNTCLQCDMANNYYMNTNTTTCVLNTAIPNYNGANQATGNIALCAVSNCKVCQLNYSFCDECNAGLGYYMNVSDNKCYTMPQFAVGYGIDLTASPSTIKPCTTSRCTYCVNDNRVCQTCDTANMYYLNMTDKLCVLDTLIDDFYGPNLSTGKIVGCINAFCTKCKASYLSCTGCDTFNGYYLNANTSMCVHINNMPTGYGADYGNGQVSACTSANCTDCKADNTFCNSCNTNLGSYLKVATGTCIHNSSMPTTFGPDLPTGTVLACQDVHCLQCNLNRLLCTGCDTSALYYLNTTSQTCILQSSIISGNGANTVLGTVAACQDTHCLNCQVNYSQCTSCDTTNSYYLNTSDSMCYHTSVIANYYGANLTSGIIGSCYDVHCKVCETNNAQCAQCDIAASYFNNVFTYDCIYITNISIGQGANRTTAIIENCWTTGCYSCQNDSVRCDTCLVGSNYYLQASDSVCLLNSSIPDFFGPNTLNGLVEACTDAHCRNCKASVDKCAQCDIDGKYYFDSLSKTCKLDTTLPSGFGGNSVSSNVTACSTTQCTDCHADYSSCNQCSTATGYYLDVSANQCIYFSIIPNTKGANLLTGLVASCSDTHCFICNANNTNCTRCDTLNSYYMNTTTNICILSSTIATGMGANDTTGIVEPCWKPNCSLCQPNSLVCTSCNTSGGYYLYDSTGYCVHTSQMPTSFGPNLLTGKMLACTDTHCKKCNLDRTQCVECDTASDYFLNTTSKTCQLRGNIIPGFGANIATGTIVACQDSNCDLCQDSYTVCTTCKTASNYYLNTTSKTCVLNTNIIYFNGANLVSGIIEICQVAHCKKCQLDYTVCMKCDTSSDYFMLPSSGQCIINTAIDDGSGPDLSTGLVALCNDPNCLLCKSDVLSCSRCDTNNGYYLNNTILSCVSLSSLSSGYGGDPVSGHIKACTVVGCIDCKADYKGCQTCDTAATYYLNSSAGLCTLQVNIPSRFGSGLLTGQVEPCYNTACIQCQMDTAVCGACDTAAGYYLDPVLTSCVPVQQIEDYKGADKITGKIAACTVVSCLKCQADHTICTGCDSTTGVYLNETTNICSSTFPEGYGPDDTTGVIRKCQDPNCKQCQADYSTCQVCYADRKYYLDGSGCTAAEVAPAGMGLDPATSFLETCRVELCEDCRFNYTTCEGCYESMGYYLEGNACVLMDARFSIAEGTSKPKSVAVQFVITTNPALNASQLSVYESVKASVDWQLMFVKAVTSQVDGNAQFKKTSSASKNGYMIDVTLINELTEKEYKVNLTNVKKYYNLTVDGTMFRVSSGKIQVPYTNAITAAEIEGPKATGAAIGTAIGGGLDSSPAFLPVMMTVVALDPTGVLMKFNQILKIINKLYFININYGKRLTAFLVNMGGLPELSKDNNAKVYQANVYRGKLTDKGVHLDFMSEMNYKIGLYGFVWLMLGVNYLLMLLNVRVPKGYLFVMHYGRRLHLIIFNLVFIDFIWFGSHTMLHGRGFGIFDQVIVFLCMLLITVDIVLVIDTVTDDRNWLYWIYLRKKILDVADEERKAMHFEELKKQRKIKKNTEKSALKGLPLTSKKSDKPKKVLAGKKKGDISDSESEEEVNPNSMKKALIRKVNYPNTFTELQSNYFMYSFMAFNLRVLARVYMSPLARSLFLNHVIRSVVYQAVIIGGQYSAGGVITLLISVELCKISYSVYCYVKYKYLKNIICLLMEVMQSAFLIPFLTIAMIIHPKGFDETILDFYQDAGIWIVIASCVAEYLLLLTYIGVAAYDFFKNRKVINRALNKMDYSFIKYGGRDLAKEFAACPSLAPLGVVAVLDPAPKTSSKLKILNGKSDPNTTDMTSTSPIKSKFNNSIKMAAPNNANKSGWASLIKNEIATRNNINYDRKLSIAESTGTTKLSAVHFKSPMAKAMSKSRGKLILKQNGLRNLKLPINSPLSLIRNDSPSNSPLGKNQTPAEAPKTLNTIAKNSPIRLKPTKLNPLRSVIAKVKKMNQSTAQ